MFSLGVAASGAGALLLGNKMDNGSRRGRALAQKRPESRSSETLALRPRTSEKQTLPCRRRASRNAPPARDQRTKMGFADKLKKGQGCRR